MTESLGRALIVDDEPFFRKLLRKACQEFHFDVHEATRGDEGLRLLEGGSYNLLLLDYMMPGIDGLEFLERARILFPDLPIVLITGYATVERTVQAMQAGADHVLEKTVELPGICETIRTVLDKRAQAKQETEEPAHGPSPLGPRFISKFLGPMQQLASLLERVARTDCTVLLRGESGTGKELVAKAIHERSNRSGGAFVPVNCGAIPETLLESELFGHSRGAFSGAYRDRPGRFLLAHKGTIFLDEVGEMSSAFQVKLLRVLQEHCFEPVGGTVSISADFRVLAATHRDLGQMVQEGTFREDLYYRMHVVELNIPPLRERREDVEMLLTHFVTEFDRRHHLEVQLGGPTFLEAISAYGWPGNVRELENLVERMCILKGSGPLDLSDLPPHIFARATQPASAPSSQATAPFHLPDDGIDFYKAVEEFENTLIAQALQRTSGNKNRAATILSLNRTTLVEKLKKKGLS